MRANVEILEFLPFWGGGSSQVWATSFRVRAADYEDLSRGAEQVMVGQTDDGGEGNTQQKEGSRRWEWEAATSAGPEEQGEELLHFCAVGRAQLSTLLCWVTGGQTSWCCTESCCWRDLAALRRGQGLGEVGLGLTPAHNPAVPRAFTSAHWAVESSRANWMGVNAGSKVEHFSVPIQALSRMLLPSQIRESPCHCLCLQGKSNRNNLSWCDWEGALATIPNTLQSVHYADAFLI